MRNKVATKVYGESDDLIEFEGDIRGEIGCYADKEDEASLIAFSDGTMLKAWYDDDGIWRLKVMNTGTLFDRVVPCTDSDSEPHSDVVYFKDGLKRAFSGKNCEKVA